MAGLQLANQEVELLRGDDSDLMHTARITPVHPASEGIATRTIRELVYTALQRLPTVPDPLPTELVDAESLSDTTRHCGGSISPRTRASSHAHRSG